MSRRSTPLGEPYPGAVDCGRGLVSFGLVAPGKKSVELLADFNGWQPGADALEPRPDGLWWLQKEVPPGRFCYKFFVDGRMAVCDPYAREVQPDPDDKQPRAVFEAGRKPFRWRHEIWRRPALRELIIHEIHVPDFSPEGSFRGVTDRLDYLQDLGVNAIELLPVQEAQPRDYWGYQPTYFFAARGMYGTNDQLKELIDEAHGRGIAVILDVVFAHTSWNHPYYLMYEERKSPWYGAPIGRPNQFGMPPLSFRKPATLRFLRDVQYHWLHEFRVDGVRYDYIASIAGNRKGEGTPWLVKTAREIDPQVYCIGEWLPEEPDKVANLGLDAVWHGRTVAALRCLSDETRVKEFNWVRFKQAVQVLDPKQQAYPAAEFMINYVESHDEHRVVRTAMRAGFDLDTAVRKSALIATVLMTAAGEPMLYQGQEFGERCERRKNEPNKLHWELLSTYEGAWLHRHMRTVCRLRRASSAFSAGTLVLVAIDARNKTAVWHRSYGAERAVVAVNFSGSRRVLKIPFPELPSAACAILWEDFFSGDTVEVSGFVEWELQPYVAQVFFPADRVPAIRR